MRIQWQIVVIVVQEEIIKTEKKLILRERNKTPVTIQQNTVIRNRVKNLYSYIDKEVNVSDFYIITRYINVNLIWKKKHTFCEYYGRVGFYTYNHLMHKITPDNA